MKNLLKYCVAAGIKGVDLQHMRSMTTGKSAEVSCTVQIILITCRMVLNFR